MVCCVLLLCNDGSVQAELKNIPLNKFKLEDYDIPYGYAPCLLAHSDTLKSVDPSLDTSEELGPSEVKKFLVRVCVRACDACVRACDACVRACVRACDACVRPCVHARLRACVPACLRACLPACVSERAGERGNVGARGRARCKRG